MQAPVDVLIVKNSGHNWQASDAGKPSLTRDEILDRTVKFFIDHLLVP